MPSFKLTALAALAVTSFASVAPAQDISRVGPPAEVPPASFEGSQFVDSRGCVYVRAGVDGATNWVPRVARDRQPICGQTPTFRARTVTVAEASPVIITPQPTTRTVQSRTVPNRTVSQQKYTAAPQVRQERIVPKHVYDKNRQEVIATVPKGYKPAWEDDRLNPHRAHMTRQGYRATQQVWSNTVPRVLLNAPQDIKEPVIVGRGKGLGH